MAATSEAVILKALEGLSTRMAVTAENIANANTPGYRPLRVSFEAALASAARSGAAAVQAVKPNITRQALPAAEGVRLDLELATDNATASRYSALVEVLNRDLQLRNLAITGNG